MSSEILICYDYNGGFIVKHHYCPGAPQGTGRTVDAAVQDWIRRSRDYILDQAGKVRLWGYRFCHMDNVPEDFERDSKEEKTKVEQWTHFAEKVQDENLWIERHKCECCGSWVYADKEPTTKA